MIVVNHLDSPDRVSDMAAPANEGPLMTRILIVEDEVLLGMMLDDMIADLDHEPVGPAESVQSALTMLDDIGAAILDVNLRNGETSYEVADHLRERGIPYAFATGYGEDGVELSYRGVPVLPKPFTGNDLRIVIETLLPPGGAVASGTP